MWKTKNVIFWNFPHSLESDVAGAFHRWPQAFCDEPSAVAVKFCKDSLFLPGYQPSLMAQQKKWECARLIEKPICHGIQRANNKSILNTHLIIRLFSHRSRQAHQVLRQRKNTAYTKNFDELLNAR